MNLFTIFRSCKNIQWTRNYTLSQIMDKHKRLLLPKLLSPPQNPVCKCVSQERAPSADIPRTPCKEKQQEQIKKAINMDISKAMDMDISKAIEESIKFR